MKIVNDERRGMGRIFGLEEGINLVAGTGSIAYGQNKFGTEARAGGWDDGFLMKALVIGWERKRWSCFQKRVTEG